VKLTTNIIMSVGLLKRFSRSEVKGKGHINRERHFERCGVEDHLMKYKFGIKVRYSARKIAEI